MSGYHFQRTWRDDAGFGLRYNTPVGPFSVDVAFKIHPEGDFYYQGKKVQDPESPVRLQLSIGTF